MNKLFGFTWISIILYAMIFLMAYGAWMGVLYKFPDGYGTMTTEKLAWTVAIVAGLLLFVTFFTAQLLKSDGSNPPRMIHYERVMVVVSLIVFMVAMVPVLWFVNTCEHRQAINDAFSGIRVSSELFDRYGEYANARIQSIGTASNGDDALTRENKQELLKYMLFPAGLEGYATEVYDYLDEMEEKEPSIFNPYFAQNVGTVSDNIDKWHAMLVGISSAHHLAGDDVPDFDIDGSYMTDAKQPITYMHAMFDMPRLPISYMGFGIVALLLVLLALPYIIQPRDGKSIESLFGCRRRRLLKGRAADPYGIRNADGTTSTMGSLYGDFSNDNI